MPLLTLPFPAFDPVLIPIGPFAIRWYALAYIVGILLGWLYARRADPQRAHVGRTGAADGHRLRRLRAVGDARHHPRRPRSATCCSTTRRISSQHPLEILQLWNGGMSFHGGFVGCVLAVVLFARSARHLDPVARRSHLRLRHHRAVPRPHRQLHQRRALGSPDRRALGYGVSATAGRCRVIRASSTKRRSKGWCWAWCSGSACAPAR